MSFRRHHLKAFALLTALCLLFAACSSGQAEPPVQTSAPASSAAEEITTQETQTEKAETEPATDGKETTAAPTEADRPDWKAQYEALSAGLQQAIMPSKVETDDDFLSMTAQTLNGEEWSGKVLAEKDMTIIDCWMTWCGPCRDEMPTLQKYYTELAENIGMMSVCFDGQAETDTCRMIAKLCGVTYPVLLGDEVNGMPFYLGNYTQGIPTLLFIDPQGHCFARFVGRPLTDEIPEKDAINIIVNLALEKLKGE